MYLMVGIIRSTLDTFSCVIDCSFPTYQFTHTTGMTFPKTEFTAPYFLLFK